MGNFIQLKIACAIKGRGSVAAKDIWIPGFTADSVRHAIGRMVKSGLVVKSGGGRNTVYEYVSRKFPIDGRGRHKNRGHWHPPPELWIENFFDGNYRPKVRATGLAAVWGWGVERKVQAPCGQSESASGG